MLINKEYADSLRDTVFKLLNDDEGVNVKGFERLVKFTMKYCNTEEIQMIYNNIDMCNDRAYLADTFENCKTFKQFRKALKVTTETQEAFFNHQKGNNS